MIRRSDGIVFYAHWNPACCSSVLTRMQNSVLRLGIRRPSGMILVHPRNRPSWRARTHFPDLRRILDMLSQELGRSGTVSESGWRNMICGKIRQPSGLNRAFTGFGHRGILVHVLPEAFRIDPERSPEAHQREWAKVCNELVAQFRGREIDSRYQGRQVN